MSDEDDDRAAITALSELSPAANDPLADFPAGPPPVLTLEPEGGEPISVEAFHRDVVTDSLEVLAHSGRARFREPRSRAARTERHALDHVAAIRAAGALPTVEEYWQSSNPRNPWITWACALVLASTGNGDASAALVRGLETRDPDDATSAILAAEALALVRRPDDDPLDRALAASAHPVARSVALDACARRGALSPPACRTALASPDRALVETALRALDHLAGPPGDWMDAVRPLLESDHASTAWRAARYLTLAGDPGPYHAVRDGGELATRLGPLGLELLVMRGRSEDLAAIDARIATMPATAELLSAVGRLGHPRSWSFLAHFLTDDTLGDAAEAALVTLLGARVARLERRRPGAWRAAVQTLRPDPAVRLRGGEPWRPGAVAAEITSGSLDRAAIAARLDELTARTGVRVRADLGAWSADVDGALAEAGAAAMTTDRRWPPGGWDG